MREEAVLAGMKFLSVVLAVGTAAVGLLYLGPEILVRRPVHPGQETLVVLIEYAFPVWPLIFLASTAVLLVAIVRIRGLLVAHGVVVAVWGFYGLCLILAPLRQVPPSPILVGVISLSVCLVHFAAMRLWAALGVN